LITRASASANDHEFLLPDLGEGIEEAEILEWHVTVGSDVKEGDPFVDVETDKASVQIPAPATGRVRSIGAEKGATIKTGTLLAIVSRDQTLASFTNSEAPLHLFAESCTPVTPATHTKKSECSQVAGIVPFLDSRPLPDFEQWGPVIREPILSVRKQIVRRTVTAAQMIPHAAAMDELDITALEEKRRQTNLTLARKGEQALTLLPYLIQKTAEVLRGQRALNASLDPSTEEIIYKKYYNIRITVATEHGLVAPVVCAADGKSVEAIGAEMRELVQRAKDGTLSAEAMQRGTFTVSSLGARGALWAIPTIYYPESAILAVGRPHDKPVVYRGHIAIRKILPVTLAFDHRVADGTHAADFLCELAHALDCDS